MKHLDLFSGLGGFSLACDWLDIETICFCEIDKFCQKVLKKHWPDVEIVEDVNNVEEIKQIVANAESEFSSSRTFVGEVSEQEQEQLGRGSGKSLLLTAGFPCQPFSAAGRRKGSADDRYLWPQTLAVIEAVKPDWVLLENVAGILSMVFPDSAVGVASQASLFNVPNDEIADYDTIAGRIDGDLRQAGYETVWLVIPACAVNAPHRRDRVWIVAHAQHDGSHRAEVEGKDIGVQQKGQTWQKLCNLQSERTDSIRDDGRGNVATEDSHAGITNGKRLQEQVIRRLDNELEQPDSHAANSCEGRLEKARTELATAGFTRNDTRFATQPQSRESWEQTEPEGREDTGRGDSEAASNEWAEHWYEVAARFCRVDDEFPHRLDRNRVNRLKALGNAIVPAVAFEIIKAIVATESVLPL